MPIRVGAAVSTILILAVSLLQQLPNEGSPLDDSAITTTIKAKLAAGLVPSSAGKSVSSSVEPISRPLASSKSSPPTEQLS